MSIGTSASSRLMPSGSRCTLAVGVTGAHVGGRWQPGSGTGWPPDAMRPSEPFVSWLRT